MTKKAKKSLAVIRVRVLLERVELLPNGFVWEVELQSAKSVHVAEALEAAGTQLLAEHPHLSWAAPDLEFTFADAQGVIHDGHPPLPPGAPLVPYLKEARPLSLVLRLSPTRVALDRLVDTEQVERQGVASLWHSNARALHRLREEDAAAAEAAEARRVWFATRLGSLLQRYTEGHRALEEERAQELQQLRAQFTMQHVRYMKQFMANAQRLTGLRDRLAADLDDARHLHSTVPLERRDSLFPLRAAANGFRAAKPPHRQSLWASTLPREGDLLVAQYVARELGPPYKRGAPDGLVACSDPQPLSHQRTAMYQPGKGFLPGIDREAFDKVVARIQRETIPVVDKSAAALRFRQKALQSTSLRSKAVI